MNFAGTLFFFRENSCRRIRVEVLEAITFPQREKRIPKISFAKRNANTYHPSALSYHLFFLLCESFYHDA